jgi:glucose-6-phosphate 1-dehydrogenase
MDVEAVRAGTPEPEARRRVFGGLSRARLARSELKQYRAYNEHVNADRAKWGDKPLDNPSRTPTYARVDFSLDYPASPLHGVPIVFKSGKALDVRHSYINVHFTSGALLHFHMQGPHKESGLADEPMVFRSAQQGRCFETEPKSGWRCKSLEGGRGFVSLAPSKTNAYEVLLRAGLEGEAENFVRLDEVLESWKVWTPLLDDMAAAGDDLELELYDHGYGDHYLSHGRGAAPRQDKTEL